MALGRGSAASRVIKGSSTPDTTVGVQKGQRSLYSVQDGKANLSCGACQRKASDAKQGLPALSLGMCESKVWWIGWAPPGMILQDMQIFKRSFRTVSFLKKKNSTFYRITQIPKSFPSPIELKFLEVVPNIFTNMTGKRCMWIPKIENHSWIRLTACDSDAATSRVLKVHEEIASSHSYSALWHTKGLSHTSGLISYEPQKNLPPSPTQRKEWDSHNSGTLV